jgi:hypothetical protein
MISYRTLKIYGQHTPNTSIRVLVDDNVVKDGPVDDRVLFQFDTDVQLHGKSVVDITVISGSIILESVTATYPALFNDTTIGTVTFKQPIDKPMVQFKNNTLSILDNIEVTDHLVYDHLMLNGPNVVKITTSDLVSVYDNMNFNTNGDIRLAFKNGFFLHIDTQYDYIKQPCDWISDNTDLNLLKETLYGQS